MSNAQNKPIVLTNDLPPRLMPAARRLGEQLGIPGIRREVYAQVLVNEVISFLDAAAEMTPMSVITIALAAQLMVDEKTMRDLHAVALSMQPELLRGNVAGPGGVQ